MIVGSRRKQRGALRTHDSAGEAPPAPVRVQRSLLLPTRKPGSCAVIVMGSTLCGDYNGFHPVW